jgi:hypothetical protein
MGRRFHLYEPNEKYAVARSKYLDALIGAAIGFCDEPEPLLAPVAVVGRKPRERIKTGSGRARSSAFQKKNRHPQPQVRVTRSKR